MNERQRAANELEDQFFSTPLTAQQVQDTIESSKSDPKFNKAVSKFLEQMILKDAAETVYKAAMAGADELRLVPEAEVLARPAPEWWVPDLIQKGTVAVLAGEAGIGKTFLTIHLSRCVAAGIPPFPNHKAMQGTVLYVAAEGASSFGARVRAWDDYHHTSPAPGAVNYLESGVNLSDPESVTRLTELLDDLQPDLIILDTLSQLAAIENENDAAQMAKVFRAAKLLRDRKEGSSVILVHHVNKGSGGVRGSSVIRSNADTVIVAKAGSAGFYLSTDTAQDGKQKDGAPVKLDGFVVASHKDSAVIQRDHTAYTDADLEAVRALMSDGAPRTKVDIRQACGFEKADSSKEYRQWDRKFKKWTDSSEPTLLPTDDGKAFTLMRIMA
ncbi:AAA family ATPase [Frigoribacterium sp. VKM Ac-2836]|uniref:AAA family ATPase n=1 Tax=Frigoribacterium sp. VKM Ac-2836 TaxID=2739014 RepID=UPI001565A4A7|nr:AAA family ATPase [Frigoribacterium sp. VKM Ac-2836]NRD25542.1 AAA family ATPase [Frigoribacterium sp. VKM Ac-2836]